MNSMADVITTKDSHLASLPTTLFTPDQGHEKLAQTIGVLARKEAQAHELALLKIDIRPAWSHESNEQTGIVIDVEVKATASERFSYWDVVCERLHQLEASLSPEEQRFLNDDIALIVSRS
jgi:hypothetical protein